MTLGRSAIASSGWVRSGGSFVRTSKPIPETRPSSSALTRSSSLTRPPRAVLMISGLRFILRNSGNASMLRVAGISGLCRVMMSLSASTVSGCIERSQPLDALMGGVKGPHAEGLADAGDRLADAALAHDAERRIGEVAHAVAVKAELAGFLPHAIDDVLTIADDLPPERQDQREGLLRNGVGGVAAHVRHDDAALPAGLDIDHVIAGGRHRDHLEVRKLGERRPADRHLVGDGNARTLQPRRDIALGGLLIGLPLMLEKRPDKLDRGAEGAAVEKRSWSWAG